MSFASRADRPSSPSKSGRSGAAGRPEAAITVLRNALSLPTATEVDGALYFGVGEGTTVIAMPASPGQLLVLVELAASAGLSAEDWTSLAAAWSSRLDGETSGRPLVLDDVLWLSAHIDTTDDADAWIARTRRFLRWAEEVRLRARPARHGVH